MKKIVIRSMLLFIAMVFMIILSQCCHMNKLQGYEFRDRTVAASLPYPTPPEIFADNWEDIDFSRPVEAVIGVGTSIAKEVELSKTRAKMDSAVQMVNIPDIIRAEILSRGAEFLHFDATSDSRNSDYLFNVEIRHYGIDAKSWSAGVHYKIDARITLLDNKRGKEIWRNCFDEKMTISRQIFGLPTAAGDIITAVALSQLTAEQIAKGLENLALYTSDRIIQKLQKDFYKKRR